MQASDLPSPQIDTTSDDRPPMIAIDHPVIRQYFETLNAGELEATGALFATDGNLQPPFEPPIVGPAAIAAYLQSEAKGFVLQPRQAVTQAIADGCQDFLVSGKVQTPLFTVNVSWQFVLNSEQKIQLAKIKLLAALQELVKLRQ
jgi:hypothetical protein